MVCLWTQLVCASDLLSASQLDAQIDDPSWVIVDLRAHSDYLLGHIPGAINLPLSNLMEERDGVSGYTIAEKRFVKTIQAAGIRNDQTVIFYGDWSFLDSMRAYWIFNYFGDFNLRVLDGGLQAWIAASFCLETEVTQLPQSNFQTQLNPEVHAGKFHTFVASQNDDYQLVDARGKRQYQGEDSLTDIKGRIPSAINLPWYSLVENRNQNDEFDKLDRVTPLKSMDELKKIAAELPTDKKLILYCNGGQESAILFFVLKQQGRQAAVYDGSWFEWSADSRLDVVR